MPDELPSASLPSASLRRPPAVSGKSTGPERALHLAEHLTARLCHDISGALGTVVNAIELAMEDAGSAAEAMALAAEASAGLARQLRLLRAAWAGDGDAMGMTALLALAEGLPGARRLRIDGSAVNGVPFGAGAVRLMLNLFMLASEGLPRGGRLTLAGDPGREIIAMIDGPQAAWPVALATCLSDPAVAWQALDGARTVVAPLMALMAHQQGVRLSFLLAATSKAGPPPPLLISLGQGGAEAQPA